jgi:mitofusin
MTVGNGSTSAAAEALIASLNQDSGYGGSIAGDSALEGGDSTDWHAGMLEDRPTPAHTPRETGLEGTYR